MYSLINELDQNDIRLSLSDGELEVSFDTDEIDKVLLQKIKENKEELIAFIKQNYNSRKEDIIPLQKKDRYLASSAQQRLWIQLKLDGNSNTYNIPNSIELEGEIYKKELIEAIEATVDRHEILRTVFVEENNVLYQKVLDRKDLNFRVDYQDLVNVNKTQKAVKEYISEDSFIAFDLEQGPLMRVTLFKVSQSKWVLYFNMHHIISDGWSMHILEKDIKSYYSAFVSNTIPELSTLKIQYKDYSAWQLEQLVSPKFEEYKEYWLEKLKGEWTYLDLPFRKKNKGVRSNIGEALRTYLSSESTKKLRSFTQENRGSFFISLLSICKVLLHRYTSQKDIIIGTAVDGRDHTDLEGQIGFYVNTLILRNTIEPSHSFGSIHERIKDSTLSAFNNKLFPFDKLLEYLDLKRDVSRNSVFDVFINYNSNSINTTNEIVDDKIEFLGDSLAKFDLSIIFEEVGEKILFHVSYNKSIYDRWMMEEFMEQFKHLLSSVLEFPEKPINELDLLNEEKRTKLYRKFNNTEVAYDLEKTILDYFKENVKNNPNSVALIFEDTTLTYSELDKKSSVLSHLLINKGIEPGNFVPICVNRSFEMIIGILGVLKSGGCYVPIEPLYPKDRVDHILKEIEAKLILSEKSVEFEFEELERIDIENFKNENFDVDDIEVASKDLAYMIYTSGTTGNPKGVMNSHKGVMNRLLWQKDYLNLDESDTFLLKTPFTFDVSVWEIFLPLLCGSKLVIASPDGHKNPYYLRDIIKKEKVSIVHFVPSMLGVYMQSIKEESFDSVRNLVCSGEELSIEYIEEFRKNNKNSKIHNLYGPTEAAIDVTAIDLTESSFDHRGVSIGSPVANTEIYIVDEFNRLLPMGVIGEIAIGGIQVAEGYFKKEQLSRDKFVPNPFSGIGKVYKTGDLGMWLDDGYIYYKGRKDNQVKIRGNRVELREVEQAILSLEEVDQVVVLVDGTNTDKILTAYLVTTEINLDRLKGFLRNKLPVYMIPEIFYSVSTIPLSANGKIDKRALLLNKGEVLKSNVKFESPKNEIQKKLAELLRTELNEDAKIGVHDNFFDLGLNSIKLLRFLELINSTFNEELMPEVLFEYPSVFELAKILSKVTLEEKNEDYESKVEEMNDFFDMMAE
ncbi:amino acid adenylation domain-containing protein [Aquimarina sp. MMG015]|uniref:non-ribosomal peptide synthetase n=1 Tax=Aquimarina sp. MMG015 TaxID=2822689 RepID=UPI001B39DBC5|nr:non-ribosomal peptide synthetase [Aquimarina sp. MMG015]MBQ4803346.1 amino acid adenylation domain-containing protein [Aquimarina sp. MMG015]